MMEGTIRIGLGSQVSGKCGKVDDPGWVEEHIEKSPCNFTVLALHYFQY
jgi:hypothetical protein